MRVYQRSVNGPVAGSGKNCIAQQIGRFWRDPLVGKSNRSSLWEKQLITNLDSTEQNPVASSARSKIFWRIIPFCFVLYVIAYIDRVNIGFASLEMPKDLRF